MTGFAPRASFRRMRRTNRGQLLGKQAKECLTTVAFIIFLAVCFYGLPMVFGVHR